MPRYDVFLSHASADKPAVEHLARKLRETRIELFYDKWHLGYPPGIGQVLSAARLRAAPPDPVLSLPVS